MAHDAHQWVDPNTTSHEQDVLYASKFDARRWPDEGSPDTNLECPSEYLRGRLEEPGRRWICRGSLDGELYVGYWRVGKMRWRCDGEAACFRYAWDEGIKPLAWEKLELRVNFTRKQAQRGVAHSRCWARSTNCHG
ncbi:predicted protein [Verticillium alfalfae VaMs.102]|uniref:Predicted protein n=1 Tax=Verticillium alfalfae (strain VaMs.102 / ATCC MYA-4576 / FGSC 10136) TaxID=526221 RepID=C9SX55_VERA1|nr:predicted protein [Verticillium alfalfae VaMs.102]EEY23245.1 predicted protein [Verticillium alfalfae VaMs.102]